MGYYDQECFKQHTCIPTTILMHHKNTVDDSRSAEFGRGIKRLLECPSSPTCPLCQQGGTQESYPCLYPPLQTELLYTDPHCKQSSELQYKSSSADRATVQILHCRQSYRIFNTADRATVKILHCRQSYSKSSATDRATVRATVEPPL
jgi:hypothetical protein